MRTITIKIIIPEYNEDIIIEEFVNKMLYDLSIEFEAKEVLSYTEQRASNNEEIKEFKDYLKSLEEDEVIQ